MREKKVPCDRKLVLFRQGDMLLIEMPKLSPRRMKRADDGIVLAEGESTGHRHVLRGEKLKWCRRDGFLFVGLGAPALLVHPEHAEIRVPIGCYRVERQRQYFPGEGENHVSD